MGYAAFMSCFCTGLYYAGISMGYLYLMMGVIISAAVLPAALTLLWSKQSWLACTLSPPLGLACSLTAWLVQAKVQYGNLSVASTGANYPMLAGNLVALLSPLLFIPLLTYVFSKPQNYDWQSMKSICKADDHDIAGAAHLALSSVPGGDSEQTAQAERIEQMKLAHNGRIARYLTAFLSLAMLLLWPIPMYGSKYVFSKGFFTGWVSVGMAWLFFSAGAVVLFPIWEGRGTLARTTRCIVDELRGKGRPVQRSGGGVLVGQEVQESPSESVHEKMNVKV